MHDQIHKNIIKELTHVKQRKMNHSKTIPKFSGLTRRWIWFVCSMLASLEIVLSYNVAPKSPNIFSFPGNKNLHRSAYFGYSLGILQTARGMWLLAGAPRSNSSQGFKEPGTMFKCPLAMGRSTGECSEVILDRGYIKDSFRDNSWTGASMDIDENGKVIVCAPRWKSKRTYSEYRISGLCYSIESDLSINSVQDIDPLLDTNKQTYTERRSDGTSFGIYYYAHGEFGMDVHFTNNEVMLIGSPGVLNWQGTVAKYIREENSAIIHSKRKRRQATDYNYGLKVIPNPIKTYKILDSNYFGYAVTSGKFNDKPGIYYVAGAPRGENLFGMACVFLMKDFYSQPLHIHESRQGTQIGEYFGAAVAAPDLNGDGYSDLVVGAPFNYIDDIFEVGCVYVYSNNDGKVGKLEAKGRVLRGDIIKGGRFGTSLGTPGDLDRDGYEDLLVGAPYENDDTGAVYVFMGSLNGIREQYSQKLLPKEVSKSPLKGFGISFSRPADIDGNQYPDFAVGSFLSDDAVLMLTRPVIKIMGHMRSEPSKLSLTDKFFNLISCISYEVSDMHHPTDIVAKLTISQESEAGEIVASFRESGSTERDYIFESSDEITSCKKSRIDLKLGRSNAQNPIIMRMSLDNKDKNSTGPTNPVLSPFNKQPSNLILSFVTGCSSDVCESDLLVYAAFKDYDSSSKRLLIGEVSKITLEVYVTNREDPAFLPNVTMLIPHPLSIQAFAEDCVTNPKINHTIVVCQLKNPLKGGEKDSFSLDLELAKLDDTSSDINIKLNVDSAADVEVNPKDNEMELKLQVKKKASLKVTGWSDPEQFMYKRLNEDAINSNETVEIRHVFSVEKTEITPLREVIIDVYVPSSVINPRNGETLTFFEQLNNELSFNVNSQTCEVSKEGKRKKRPRFHNENEMQKSLNGNKESIDKDGRYTSLDCSSPHINCSLIRCKVGPWRRSYDVATLTVSFDLNLTTTGDAISVKEGFSLFSSVDVYISPHAGLKSLTGQRNDSTNIQTPFHPEELAALSLPWWVYLLFVLGGILLLMAIAYGLYKLGFFKRKEMEELKTQQATLLESEEQNK